LNVEVNLLGDFWKILIKKNWWCHDSQKCRPIEKKQIELMPQFYLSHLLCALQRALILGMHLWSIQRVHCIFARAVPARHQINCMPTAARWQHWRSPNFLQSPRAKMAYGDYPAEYNPKVHGPYDPARFYGKGELSEIGSSLFDLSIDITCVVVNHDFATKREVASSRHRFRPRRQLIEIFTSD
jgi:Mitochondrial F1F0-ATP synthase, subunit f